MTPSGDNSYSLQANNSRFIILFMLQLFPGDRPLVLNHHRRTYYFITLKVIRLIRRSLAAIYGGTPRNIGAIYGAAS